MAGDWIADMTGWLRCAPLCCCAQMLQLQEQLLEAQRAIAARDAEVARLGVRLGAGGPDVGTLSRDQWGDAYATIVLSLNKQVGQENGQ